MKKRLLPLLLAAALAAALCPAALASAGVSTPLEEAVQVICALDILVGDGSGGLQLEREVTRAEFITMAVKASPFAGQVGQASTSPFPDVPYTHWSAGFVQLGVAKGYISGYLDGTFRPDNKITLAEGATVALKLLGYAGGDFSGAYPTGQMALFRSLKLDTDLLADRADSLLTRRDAMYIFYNLLTARTKAGAVYLNQLGYAVTASGEIDRVSLINSTMEGPLTAFGDWRSQIPFELERARVYRGGGESSLSAIRPYDIVYWSKSMRTLWVYGDRVTGAVQALSPSASNPAAVTVAGRSYSIETASASYDLSDLGVWKVGDTVTLLLGRNGGVAAVAGGAAESSAALVGVVTGVDTGTYTAANGGTYTADRLTMTGTDGLTYSYELGERHGMSVGDAVLVTVKDGETVLRHASSKQLSGRVSSDAATLGRYAFASDVEILDAYGSEGAVRIYPARLAGMTLSADQIAYYSLNGLGEIDRLILKKATGDGYHYGVLTDLIDASFGMNISVTYQMDFGGVPGVLASSPTRYPVQEGPVQVQGPLSDVEHIYNLTMVKADRLTSSAVYSGNQSYTLWDSVAVYEYRNGKYYLSSLRAVQDGGFEITAWYDKAESSGGRVRVIVAK